MIITVPARCRVKSHYVTHHIAKSDIAYRRTLDQAQARPGVQDKGVRQFLKQGKKKGIILYSRP